MPLPCSGGLRYMYSTCAGPWYFWGLAFYGATRCVSRVWTRAVILAPGNLGSTFLLRAWFFGGTTAAACQPCVLFPSPKVGDLIQAVLTVRLRWVPWPFSLHNMERTRTWGMEAPSLQTFQVSSPGRLAVSNNT